jgi:hypothetical protein
MARVFDLHIELRGITPGIWRRVRVPSDITLADLHHVLQAVMAWRDHHLHLFEVAGRDYGVPPDEDWEREEWDGVDEATLKLTKALADGGGAFEYLYDFRDEWRIGVSRAEETTVPGPRVVECLEGELAAPPEGIGGPQVYQELCDTWRRLGEDAVPVHVRDAWPAGFDPKAFDLAKTNARLRSIFGDGGEDAGPPQFADADEEFIADVTLLALFLGSWEEASGRRTAWKTLRFEVLDVLKREGLIETTPARKSVVMTDAGVRRAAALRRRIAARLESAR